MPLKTSVLSLVAVASSCVHAPPMTPCRVDIAETLESSICKCAPKEGGPVVDLPIQACNGKVALDPDELQEHLEWDQRNCKGPK